MAKRPPILAWDNRPSVLRYRDWTTGRFVSRTAVNAKIRDIINIGEENVKLLTQQLIRMEITPAQWQAAMVDEIKQLHASATMAAVGGEDQATLQYWREAKQRLADQLQRLNNFAAQLEDGSQPLTGQVINRARMYARAARATYENLRHELFQQNGYLWESWQLGDAEHCDGCIEQAGKGWVEIGNLPEIGSQDCLTNCQCSIEYSMEREE